MSDTKVGLGDEGRGGGVRLADAAGDVARGAMVVGTENDFTRVEGVGALRGDTGGEAGRWGVGGEGGQEGIAEVDADIPLRGVVVELPVPPLLVRPLRRTSSLTRSAW